MKKSSKVIGSESNKETQFLDRTARVTGLAKNDLKLLLSVDRASIARINELSGWPKQQIVEELQRNFDISPLLWYEGAFILREGKKRLAESELFQKGHVYIQNASSLIPPLALDPQPGEKILDVCAAPGGKASFIAALVNNEAELWLNDALKNRLRKLREVMEIFGVKFVSMTGFPGQYIDKFVEEQFDRILLDAQCTSEARVDFRERRPLIFWSLKRVHEYSRLQKKMLVAAFKLLRPGGTLVYSTCTFSPEENEMVVSYLLKHYPEARMEEIGINGLQANAGMTEWEGEQLDPQVRKVMRILPTDLMEGFFVCKIVKSKG